MRAAAARAAALDEAVGQIVEAYVLFRRPLLDVLASTLARYPEMGAEIGQVMRRAERFMDALLAGMTARRAPSREPELR